MCVGYVLFLSQHNYSLVCCFPSHFGVASADSMTYVCNMYQCVYALFVILFLMPKQNDKLNDTFSDSHRITEPAITFNMEISHRIISFMCASVCECMRVWIYVPPCVNGAHFAHLTKDEQHFPKQTTNFNPNTFCVWTKTDNKKTKRSLKTNKNIDKKQF